MLFPTRIKDLDLLILEKLEDRDIVNISRVNKYCYELYNNENFWYKKLNKRFACAIDIQTYKHEYLWKELYIELYRAMENIYEDKMENIYEDKMEDAYKDSYSPTLHINDGVIHDLILYVKKVSFQAVKKLIKKIKLQKKDVKSCMDNFFNILLVNPNYLIRLLPYSEESLDYLLKHMSEHKIFRLTPSILGVFNSQQNNIYYFEKFLQSQKYNNNRGREFILALCSLYILFKEDFIHKVLDLMSNEELIFLQNEINCSDALKTNDKMKRILIKYYKTRKMSFSYTRQ